MTIEDHSPQLTRRTLDRLSLWTDEPLAEKGVTLAFTERGGGVSQVPYASLNLAAHVGDEPARVDANRARVLDSLGLGGARGRLVTAEQVHGVRIHEVTESDAGCGAFAVSGPPAVAEADCLCTSVRDTPLLMCYADCVPIVVVAPGPLVCVVHAGWRGALAGFPGSAALHAANEAGCRASDLLVYIGPHIGGCCYEIGPDLLSHFCNTFGKVARAQTGGLDLQAVVRQSLTESGVSLWRITSLGMCTAEETERFFSYRAEGGTTGRHAAIACVTSPRF